MSRAVDEAAARAEDDMARDHAIVASRWLARARVLIASRELLSGDRTALRDAANRVNAPLPGVLHRACVAARVALILGEAPG